MNTRLLMMSSAVVLDLAGVGATFAPHEILAAAGIAAVHPLPVMVQLMGALYIGFAMANWTARANMIGGIYSRPLSLSNCIHFVAGELALVKSGYANGLVAPIVFALVAYALFAMCFS